MLGKKKNEKKELAYEKIMDDLFHADTAGTILEKIMEPDEWQEDKQIPLRYRLIGLGFLKHETLEELNDNLLEHSCRPLYARSRFECTLIYAFARQMPYKKWKNLYKVCASAKVLLNETETSLHEFFKGGKITFEELETYILTFSDITEDGLETKQITKVLNQQLDNLGDDYREFFRFYISNQEDFSEVHERARYYFCKYLYYHIIEKIDNYVAKVGERVPSQEELLSLLPLKAESKLRRRVTKPEVLMDVLRKCSISPRAIFEEFNYYFFEYVSIDWVWILLDNIDSIDDLSWEQIEKIANYLRENNSQNRENDNYMLVLDEWKRIQSDDVEWNTSRKGENAIRKYIKGELDFDRTTLICFLLYLGSSAISRTDIKISVDRIDEILDECGFSVLRRKEPFDNFVIQYINSKDPVDFLMDEMDKYLKEGKNFFIYEMYTNSTSNAKELKKLMEKNIL